MQSKVLIVDDEPHIRLLIEQALEDLVDEGVELLLATDGEQALEIIRRELPQLIFLDVMMPKMNGFDVCQIVKDELGGQDIHIVMLTAKGQEYNIDKGYDVGADIYMTKPFDPDELLVKARAFLNL
jgi:DNA-binding response OmpR family regulator